MTCDTYGIKGLTVVQPRGSPAARLSLFAEPRGVACRDVAQQLEHVTLMHRACNVVADWHAQSNSGLGNEPDNTRRCVAGWSTAGRSP